MCQLNHEFFLKMELKILTKTSRCKLRTGSKQNLYEIDYSSMFRDWRRQTLVGWEIAVPIYTLGVRMTG